ncbi:zinc finger protein 436-like [Poeciliopsis prolifica]|uniref:zinc finger protein 436-like n=1 Tax=Poeciliopsis prolifica TaxID=188132 RepID=UPI002413E723|nr:zinc finger protein 436-like [Poeciliopsis prolifica]
MADVAAVRSQVVLVVNSLGRTLLAQLREAERGSRERRSQVKLTVANSNTSGSSGACRGFLVRRPGAPVRRRPGAPVPRCGGGPVPGAPEELGVAVDRLCLEAADQILKILETSMTRQEEAPPTPADTRGGLMKTQTGEQEPGAGHAYFLYGVSDGAAAEQTLTMFPFLSAAGDSRRLLVALQSAGGESTCCSAEDGALRSSWWQQKQRVSSHSATWRRGQTLRAEAGCDHGERGASPAVLALQQAVPQRRAAGRPPQEVHPLCSVCGAAFSGVLKLREHQLKEHGLLPFACGFCPKSFNHKTHRDLHVKARHTGDKSCRCDICGKGYSCVGALKTHRVTHFSKTLMCEVCGKAFYHASHLTRHTLVHQEPRPFSCSTCGRRFTQAGNLRSHQATHAGEKQLCSVCGKSFRCLRNHMISRHAQEAAAAGLLPPAVTCQVCGKKFPNPSQHRAHQRSHTGDKPFHCDVCGRSYRLQQLLQDHRYTHGGQKPYSCSACAQTFSRASSFLRHRSIHGGQAPHSCQRCGKHFRLRSFLRAHLQTQAHLRRMQQSL